MRNQKTLNTIWNTQSIPYKAKVRYQELIEDKYTFYVKSMHKDIKYYEFDYMDIMQNAFLFHTKDCVGNPDLLEIG